MQRRFLIDNALLRSGDIRDQVEKLFEIMPKFWAAKFRVDEGVMQISDRILQTRVTNNQVAKFGDDQPSDLRDKVAKKRQRKDLNYSGKTEWPAASLTV